jgi:putative ABC transport system permease protein
MHFIAIRMLTGDRAKYIAIVIGFAFAALIMAQQPAIMFGLLSTTSGFIRDVGNVDVWVTSASTESVDDGKPISEADLYRIRGVQGVAWAVPLYKGVLLAKLPDGRSVSTEVVGVDDNSLFGLPSTAQPSIVHRLRIPDGIVIEEAAVRRQLAWKREGRGAVEPLRIGDELELNDHRAIVVDLVRTSPTFIDLPTIYTTYSRAKQFAPRQRRLLTFILVKGQQGVNSALLARRISDETGYAAYSQKAFMELTERYYRANTGIPVSFGLVVAIGFVGGAAIAAQSFFNFTRDNVRQFATLKALGTGNHRLFGMVLLQGIVAGAIGWGLGVGFAALSGLFIPGEHLGFLMTWHLLALSAAGTLGIVACSALPSLWSVFRLEPAVVFR